MKIYLWPFAAISFKSTVVCDWHGYVYTVLITLVGYVAKINIAYVN